MASIKQLLNLDPDEEIIHQVKRHPIGLWAIYIGSAVGIAGIAVVAYLFSGLDDSLLIEIPDGFFIITFAVVTIVLAIFAVVGTIVYESNELVLTNENILQVLRFSLFNRQLSQLNLAKIQDVSVDQKGIVQTALNYGTIEIETAGEASNFKFPYAPNPNTVAKEIIEAHEKYVQRVSGGPVGSV